MRNTSHSTPSCHPSRAFALLLLAATLLASPLSATDPNIVVIVLDDLGIEHVEQYAIGNQGQYVPFTNFHNRINSGADDENWLTVGRAWSNPLCSPTRATILSGMYGRSNGIGTIVEYGPSEFILDADDADLLPKNLGGYDTALFGKWHVGVEYDGDDSEPYDAGFDYFEAIFRRYNSQTHDFYLDYQWSTLTSTNPSVDVDTERICREQAAGCDVVDSGTYLTVDMTDAALDWLANDATEPFFLYVAHYGVHGPWNCPPSDAYIGSEYGPCTEQDPSDLDAYRGMMQIVDEQLDRLLDVLAIDENTYVFIISDNGSPGVDALALEPFDDETRVKGTVYEGGVRVPFFVGGPADDMYQPWVVVDGDLSEELFINVSDLYATILELSGETENPNDTYWERNQSQSFLDYITDATPDRIRDCAYTERFVPNGFGGRTADDKAIVGTTTLDTDIFKYVVTGVGSNVALYNLTEDLAEGTNLCSPSCDATEEDIIDELVECSDQFRDTSCEDADKNQSCGPSTPCCPGLFCSSQSGTCVDPI